jgi:hypothetical protein
MLQPHVFAASMTPDSAAASDCPAATGRRRQACCAARCWRPASAASSDAWKLLLHSRGQGHQASWAKQAWTSNATEERAQGTRAHTLLKAPATLWQPAPSAEQQQQQTLSQRRRYHSAPAARPDSATRLCVRCPRLWHAQGAANCCPRATTRRHMLMQRSQQAGASTSCSLIPSRSQHKHNTHHRRSRQSLFQPASRHDTRVCVCVCTRTRAPRPTATSAYSWDVVGPLQPARACLRCRAAAAPNQGTPAAHACRPAEHAPRCLTHNRPSHSRAPHGARHAPAAAAAAAQLAAGSARATRPAAGDVHDSRARVWWLLWWC